jgi:hypothetical protein
MTCGRVTPAKIPFMTTFMTNTSGKIRLGTKQKTCIPVKLSAGFFHDQCQPGPVETFEKEIGGLIFER